MVMKPQSSPEDLTQPVAYDADGRPLYHHPPQTGQPAPVVGQTMSHVTSRPEIIDGENFDPRIRSQYANEPQVVHVAREIDPKPFMISDEVKAKHDESVARYPDLNLSEGEYVILDIKRHPIGMIIPVAVAVLLIVAIMVFVVTYPSLAADSIISGMPSLTTVFGIALLFIGLVALGGAVALWIYLQNQFYLTNESVIQEIQESLVSRHEQTVSLGSIEDASFRQSGIIQTILNYGTIRLSTEGEETTYIFQYVANPRQQIAIINNAIEDFKLEGEEGLGVEIVKKALSAPLRQIVINAGIDAGVVIEKVKNSENGTGFDAAKEEYVDMVKAGIIDPAKVTRSAIQNAVSVSSVLLTTEVAVGNEKEETPAGGGMPGGMGMPGMM